VTAFGDSSGLLVVGALAAGAMLLFWLASRFGRWWLWVAGYGLAVLAVVSSILLPGGRP
jgi:hypothetical protein